MGGVLVISTMDPLQLPPIQGRPPLLSPYLITCFMLFELKHSVRASLDSNFRRIQDITRMLPTQLTQEILEEFKSLIIQNCTFVPNWNDPRIPDLALRVFGKWEAVFAAELDLLNKIKNNSNVQTILSLAKDEESTPAGHWKPASKITSARLSKKVKEPTELLFYPGALYEISYNKDNHFSTKQLAVLCEDRMPSIEQVKQFEPIELMVAPEGCKSVPGGNRTKAALLQHNWRTIFIGSSPSRIHAIKGGLQAKRHQYGLRHRVASTNHSIMGQTLDKLVTSVGYLSAYMLWEREQIVVLLSHTRFAIDIIFVGNPQETADFLAKVLLRRSQYTDFICHFLEKFQGSKVTIPELDLGQYPYRPKDFDIPKDDSGFVYLLLSLKDNISMYIGQTRNISRRLRQHNSGYGALQTASHHL